MNTVIRTGASFWLVLLISWGTHPQPLHCEVRFDHFEKIAILHEGRVKPLDTFARHILLQLSGKSQYNGKSAIAWLASALFTPQRTHLDRVFLINHPEVLQALDIPKFPSRRYSFSDIKGAFPRLQQFAVKITRVETKDRSPVEEELVRLYNNAITFIMITHAFQFAMPNDIFTVHTADAATQLGLTPGQPNRFIDILDKSQIISKIIDPLQSKPKAQWTPVQAEVLQLSQSLFKWAQHFSDQSFFRVIPDTSHATVNKTPHWKSPWTTIGTPPMSPFDDTAINLWTQIMDGYLASNSTAFDTAARQLIAHTESVTSLEKKIALETFYNHLDPFYKAEILYGLALLLVLLSFLFSNHTIRKWITRIAWGIALIGFVPHTGGIIIRMALSGRPPVTNLFETFVFVAWITVLLGLLIELINHERLGLLSAAVTGLSLLLIAGKYSSEGDTLHVLVAVLDSNFWLSTHVITITTGYAGCCMAGVIGHLYLIQAAMDPHNKSRRHQTHRILMGVLGFGLTFSFLGTILGGIWADQSWGRFWGWDPKENGALMIVLWCAVIFHARLSGLIKPFGVAVLSVIGIMVVMFAWFGINLLGVGLHSYGFTSGIARNLTLYIVCQTIFLIVITILIKHRSTP